MIINKTVFTDSPESSGRLSKEMECYKILKHLGIPFQRVDHDAAMSLADCDEIGIVLGTSVCKNLFLCNSSKTNFYLLMMQGDKSFRTKEISSQLSISRLSFAPQEYMERLLNLTPGSVSILGLMYDTELNVRLLIDSSLRGTEYFGCHPCINTSTLKIKTSDLLEKFLPYVRHSPTFVSI
jgi:Ala-tRNA(Pro) deacylase